MESVNSPHRIDVFSLKGGVGKTTVALHIARGFVRERKRHALLIDADFTGSCLGDLVQPNADPAWSGQWNLAHMICDAPEKLGTRLRHNLPVHRLPEMRSTESVSTVSAVDPASVCFSPSHLYATPNDDAAVDIEVLHAMISQENGGGWVGHVIDELIRETAQRLGGLGLVVVDHSPGISGFASVTLHNIKRHQEAGGAHRRAVMVSSRDPVDLMMTRQFDASRGGDLKDRLRYVINRVPSDAHWHELAAGALGGTQKWFADAVCIDDSSAYGDAYWRSNALDLDSAACDKLAALYKDLP